MEDQFLYHGTTRSRARAILKDGLQPRRVTGHSNYAEQRLDSSPDHVYLTDDFGPYYGNLAGDEDGFAVVEVTMPDADELYPDEDYVEWALRGGDIPYPDDFDIPEGVDEETHRRRTQRIRDELDRFQGHWRASLDRHGTVAKKGDVPAAHVRRATFVSPMDALREELDRHHNWSDTAHRLLTDHLFGADVEDDEYLNHVYGWRDAIGDDIRRQVRDVLTDEDCFEVAWNDAFDGE